MGMMEMFGSKGSKGYMAIMDLTGDTKSTWDPTNADEVAAAKATFETLVGKGYKAFEVDKKVIKKDK